MPLDPYLQQLKQNVKVLLSEKQFKNAEVLCAKVLKMHPEYKDDVRVLLDSIRRGAAEANNDFIEAKLDSFEPLWDKKDYVSLIKECRELLKVNPNDARIKEELLKAQSEYKKSIDAAEERFEKSEMAKLDELLKSKPDLLLEELFDLELKGKGNEAVLALTAKYRDLLIAKKLDEHKELLHEDKPEDLEHLLFELEKIDPKNARLKKLRSLVDLIKMEDFSNQKLEFLYAAKQNLETLMQIGKFDKALQVAEEILVSDPNDKFALKIEKRAKKRLFAQTRNVVVEKISENQKALDEDFARDPEAYIKL